MKLFDKSKTQKLIKKIESGHFDYDDVENLLMKLRDYCGSNQVFREIADFVAHKKERDRGVIKTSLEFMALSLRFYKEYHLPKKKLDLSNPFPKWIKKFMLYQVDKLDGVILKSEYSFDKNQLKTYIKDKFNYSDNETVILKDESLSSSKIAVLSYLFSQFIIFPTFTQKQVIEAVIEVIEKNNLLLDTIKFLENQNIFILNLILLMHCTEYKNGKTIIGYSLIHGFEDNSSSIFVGGHIKVDEDMTYIHSIINTDLITTDYIHDDILKHKKLNNSGFITLPQNIDISNSNILILTALEDH